VLIGEAADEVSVQLAEQLKKTMQQIVSVPGNPKEPAKRYAPPRRITGRLMKGIKRRKNRVIVEAPYAWFLEYTYKRKSFPHKFILPALRQLGLVK
jgi:hypothetical protein